MMYTKKSQVIERIMAVCLSLLIVLATVQTSILQVFAATENHPGAYTITVLDKDGDPDVPVSGATVNYAVEVSQDGGSSWVTTQSYLDDSLTTDMNGEMVIDGVASEGADFTPGDTQVRITYRISKSGYTLFSNIASPTVLTDSAALVNNEEIEMHLIKEDLVEGTDFTVSGLVNSYNGTPHPVSVTAPGCTVTYSEDAGVTYTAIVPSITNAGSKDIKIKIIKSGYNELVLDRTLTVNKIDRSDFAFATPNPTDVTYATGVTYTNIATSSQDSQAVTYGSSDNEVATVDSAGVVTFSKAGTVTITASMPASMNYNLSEVSYTIKALYDRPAFYFETSTPSAITYATVPTYTNTAVNVELDGTVTYSIISQTRDGVSVSDVATIIGTTGELSINASGVVVVKAEVDGVLYKDAEITYSLTINRATQTGFAFATPSPSSLPYNSTLSNLASGGQGTGSITYSIVEEIPTSPSTDVVSIDMNGKITAKGIGNATIQATKAQDSCYEAATATYSISTVKAEQTDFVLTPSGTVNVSYGASTYQLVTTGGESTGGVTFRVFSDPSGVGSVDSATGLVTFNDEKWGKLTIVATKQGDTNYNVKEVSVTLDVKTENMSDDYSIQGTSLTTGWYTSDVSIVPSAGYLISNSSSWIWDNWKTNFSYNTEGQHSEVTIYLAKLRWSNSLHKYVIDSISSAIVIPTFSIDKSDPTTPTVTYSTSFFDAFLESISFGFYNAPVTVTVTASDAVSGIDHFTYNIGSGDVTIPKSSISFSGTTATATFTIDNQFKGKVSAKAYDTAGRSSSYSGDKVIVVDTVAPGVTVSYDNNDAANTNYYKAARTATITVTESNFYAEDAVITVGKRYNGESTFTEGRIYPTFTKSGDTYTATVDFNEDADYTFDITYTDKSGNIFDSYTSDEFTVDLTNPVLSIDGISAGEFYGAGRTVTFTVTEHNFNASDIAFSISGFDVQGNPITISEDFASYLRNPANWMQTGNVHTAQITLTADAAYTINFNYSDLSGRGLSGITGVDAACIDSVTPSNLTIEYSTSVLETILETVSFGFYKADAVVTISAEDATSGVGSFTYSYRVSDGASATNIGAEAVTIQEANISYSDGGRKATATFVIPAQFHGSVDFYATDRSGNFSAARSDGKIIVVDNVAPGINVVYDNNSVQNGNYYKSDRTATISITEANYFAGDMDEGLLVITVGKRLNNETAYTETNIKPVFSKNGDVYTATVTFTEDADYTFDIKYADHSGNIFDSYNKDEFTVDKTKPEVTVSYDNNAAMNGNCFKANRTATITIEEHNFNPADVNVSVSATDASGNSVAVTDFATYAKTPANWTGTGDSHTLLLTFDKEANYSFSINYSDLAGNENATVNYGISVAPTIFTIDKTAPTASVQVGPWSQSEDGTVWDHFLSNVSFKLWDNDTVTVTVQNNDSLSGVDVLEYFRSDTPMTLEAVKAHSEWTKADNSNRSFSSDVNPDERFVVYIHVTDKAGNELYLSSDGIILDKTLPDVEKVCPEISVQSPQPANGIYAADVKMDVTVKDPAGTGADLLYSGLNTVRYEVYNYAVSTTAPTQSGTLFDKTSTILTKDIYGLIQIYEAKECITVDKTLNNSNEVYVKIIALDNAGNTNTKTYSLKIDTTAPEMYISYSNNNADNGSFFNADRTATIVVTERNFKAEDMKISIKNTDGVIPAVSGWVSHSGTGNLDNTTWTATINYVADGDYEFSVAYTDKAGNPCAGETYRTDTVAAKAFTIDKTLPKISVSYDNNAAMNGNYYKENRKATISITEHNFDSDRVDITLKASDNGQSITAPVVSAWTTHGDTHTATISYDQDALYGFDIAVQDKAGNDSADYREESFYIDTSAPTLGITGVTDKSANNGDVIPVVSYFDQNFDAEQVKITLVGANRKGVSLDGTYDNNQTGGTFTFENFPEEKDTDDIYTLTANLTDKAGNTSTKTVLFSVNRFGSTYLLSQSTESLNGSYVKSPIDLVISEINVNSLKDIKLTLYKNDETIVLVEGTDYSVDFTGGDGKWYQYTYTVFQSNFEEDGIYRLAIYSKDVAGNESENNMDTKNSGINFVIDKTMPNVVITNLESHKTYPVDLKSVLMSANDNLLLNSVVVYLDDYDNAYRSWNAEEIKGILAGTGEFTFDISGDSKSAHKLKVVCIDAAGNEKSEEITNFFVTTDVFVRYYNNKPLFFGSIAGGTLIAALGVVMVLWIRRRKWN